jgi:enediyne biosynthesis protein E4
MRPMFMLPIIVLVLQTCTGTGTARLASVHLDDVSDRVGLSETGPGRGELYGPFWVDLDQDRWVDLVFMRHGNNPVIYMNHEGLYFRNEFAGSGIRGVRRADWEYPQQRDRHGAACADYDNDGYPDLFLTHGAKRGDTIGIKYDELLHNQGDGTFREVSREAGVLNSEGRARWPTWIDYDNDGWIDLYVGNFAGPNVMYRNRGDGRFTEVSRRIGLHLAGHFRPSWSDYDGDGDADLLAAPPVGLFENRGPEGFVEVTRRAALEDAVKTPLSVAWGDLDGDRDPDLVLGSWGFASGLLVNRGGVFTAAAGPLSRIVDRTIAVAWGDLDNDGDLDLVITGDAGVRIVENRRGRLVARSLDLGDGTVPSPIGGVALADYDNDGDLDVALEANARHYLLQNTRSGRSWLKIRFVGTASNRMGIGAKVEVTVRQRHGSLEDRVLWREYTGDTGYSRSTGCAPLHIGLGRAESVDVRILWPSGAETVLTDVPVDQEIEITEE